MWRVPSFWGTHCGTPGPAPDPRAARAACRWAAPPSSRERTWGPTPARPACRSGTPPPWRAGRPLRGLQVSEQGRAWISAHTISPGAGPRVRAGPNRRPCRAPPRRRRHAAMKAAVGRLGTGRGSFLRANAGSHGPDLERLLLLKARVTQENEMCLMRRTQAHRLVGEADRRARSRRWRRAPPPPLPWPATRPPVSSSPLSEPLSTPPPERACEGPPPLCCCRLRRRSRSSASSSLASSSYASSGSSS